jgi:hypothetical protein
MPTVSILDRRREGRSRSRRFPLAIAVLAALASSLGCLGGSGVVVEDLLVPIAPPVPWLPGEADLAVAELVQAALAAQPQPPTGRTRDPMATPRIQAALATLTQRAVESDSARLVPLAHDVRNSTLDDPIAYRKASEQLRSDYEIDARLESRLDRIIADDPLRLARRRQLDGWERLWARTFNAVSEPLGSSLITGFVIAPFTVANSIIHYFAAFSNMEPLSGTGRQALVHRKDFLARHPDTEVTGALEKKIASDELLLEKTLALRRTRLAERSFDDGRPRLANVHADAATQILSAHPSANSRLRKRAKSAKQEAAARVEEIDRLRADSLGATPSPRKLVDLETRLTAKILAGPLDLVSLEPAFRDFTEAGGGEDQVEFVRSIAQHENGYEAESREQVERVARRRVGNSKMARHARSLADDEWQNPYPAFVRLRSKAVRDELAWRLAGEWVRRPRYPNLPTPIAYLIDTPTIAITIVLAPLRALLSPFQKGPDFDRAPALAGYRYLLRFPGGVDQGEVLEWLYEYETDHDRYARALRLADLMPEFDAEERLELVEQAAESQRVIVDRLDRRDTRASVLKGVAREYPDSDQGREAGMQARKEALDASAQHIRLTKGFLLENPDVAGREGIGLEPRLLNDDDADGELHPEGVVLRGERTLEIRLIAEGADDDDPPESRFRKIGKQRLAQIASSLDAAVHRNSLADLEARQLPDANRDAYLERAALELTEDEDQRAAAESSFVYQSLRERYGLVRGRESILPFDLVFRGSLGDFTLGAFPRWRAPRETPDSFLYR